jgi:hypothetical protein
VVGWSDEQVAHLCARIRNGEMRPGEWPPDDVLESLPVRLFAMVQEAAAAYAFAATVAAQGRGEATPGVPVFVFAAEVPDDPSGLIPSD